MPGLGERIRVRATEINKSREAAEFEASKNDSLRTRKWDKERAAEQGKKEKLLEMARKTFNHDCFPILEEVADTLGVPMRSVTKGLFVKDQVSNYRVEEKETEISGVLTWDYTSERGHADNSGRMVDYIAWKSFELIADGSGRIQYRGQWYRQGEWGEMNDRIVEDVAKGDFSGGNDLPEYTLSDAP